MGSGTLKGVRIVDFSHVFQGPVATQLLADLGADVIKVERPGSGDWSRAWGPFVAGVSMPFAALNRNKRSIVLDLRRPEAKEVLMRLLATADVLVHNFRPGVMERLGLGYNDLKESFPRLIYAASSGWGDVGPYVERGRPGHDLLARAEAGWFEATDARGCPAPAGISADYPAGLLLSIGILAALLARERTGRGQLVTTDLFSAAIHAHAWDGGAVLNAERIDAHSRVGVTEQVIAKSFRTRDGFIEISPVFSADALRDLSLAMGLGDLSQDPRFCTDALRLANAAALNDILQARFLEHTTQEWIERLEPQGIVCGRIRSLAEAIEDPQALANGMIVFVEHPRAGMLRLFGTPLRLYGTPPTVRLPPPDLGEHAEAILQELGYSAQEISSLRACGALG